MDTFDPGLKISLKIFHTSQKLLVGIHKVKKKLLPLEAEQMDSNVERLSTSRRSLHSTKKRKNKETPSVEIMHNELQHKSVARK